MGIRQSIQQPQSDTTSRIRSHSTVATENDESPNTDRINSTRTNTDEASLIPSFINFGLGEFQSGSHTHRMASSVPSSSSQSDAQNFQRDNRHTNCSLRSSANRPRMRSSRTRILSSDSSSGNTESNRHGHSMPFQMFEIEQKCPVCNKILPSDDAEMHLIRCLAKHLTYNEDTLKINKGECAICLEEMEEGHLIARLPCFCVYHKGCIDEWFKRKNTCPEHPPSDE